jgi:hypothetical protein
MARIQSARRHGPFDPRFRLRASQAAQASRLPLVKPQLPPLASGEQLTAVASWEGEGGAL